MEFGDEELERRFDCGTQRDDAGGLLAHDVDDLHGAPVVRRLSVFLARPRGSRRLVHLCPARAVLVHHPRHSFYVHHRTVFALTQKMFFTVNGDHPHAGHVEPHHPARRPRATQTGAEGMVEALQAWNPILPSREELRIARVAAKSGQPPPVNTLPAGLVFGRTFQCFGSHITLRVQWRSSSCASERDLRFIKPGMP